MERFTRFTKFSSSLNDLIGSMAEALSSSQVGTALGNGLVPVPVIVRNGGCIRHPHGRKPGFRILTPDGKAVPGRNSIRSRLRRDAMRIKTSLRAGA
jgi:hypothetical protein